MKKLTAFALLLIIVFSSISTFATDGASDWASSYIDTAIESGILPEEFQGNYTQDLSRLEFTHIAVRLISVLYSTDDSEIIKGADTSVFSDTSDAYVSSAYALGIIDGMGDGTFDPYDGITRQEAAKILVNTYSVCTGKYDILTDNEHLYSDYVKISDWAKPYVNTVSELGIMDGTGGGRFSPFDSYTREQGVVTFVRLYDYILDTEGISPDIYNKNPEITAMLTVKDGLLYSGDDEVILNGVNLGGWLQMEAWMSPISNTDNIAYSDIIDILRKRFGENKTNELLRIYEDSYITEDDFELIEALGFNCVRIPFWYRNFMDEDGNWLTTVHSSNPGFQRLDWALEQCKKHNLYAILDMHGCPGGQSMDHSTGITGKNELYDNEENLGIMENLWTEIANRYKNNKYVAAYDIMNEPQNNGGHSGERAWPPESPEAVTRTNSVYRRMVKAIRQIDRRHIITVEGIWSIGVLPDPKEYGWENMMYQLHIYDDLKHMVDTRVNETIEAREKYGVAVLVGEYNSKNFERYAADKYIENKISRIKWTYKTVGVDYDSWGLMNKDFDKIDITTASYEEIKRAFGTDMLTENGFELNIREYNMIK